MTLYKLVQIIKEISLLQPNVGSVNEGNIYDINANPSVKYANITLTQGTHTQDEIYDHYNFTIFYTDRLMDNLETNRLQIQSIGKSVLSNIITTLANNYDIEYQSVSYQPFTQRFSNECAGMYITITFDIPKDVICGEVYGEV